MEIVELFSGRVTTFSRRKMRTLEAKLSKLPQLPPEARPVRHIFAPGVYLREIFLMPGACATGAIHRFDHACMSLGDISVYSQDGGLKRITGCETFVSTAGVKRAVFVHAPTWFTTIHANPTNERDPEKLAAMFTVEDWAQLPGVTQ
jgi:hypothetical protein